MKRIFLLFLLFFLVYPGYINAQTYPEVWFENSSLPLRYSNSHVSYSGDSWIKNIKHQLPISDTIFFTPKNALEIKYTSGKSGHWAADIYYPMSINFKLKEEFTLNFKLYIQSKTSIDELPAIEFIQSKNSISPEVLTSDTSASSLISLKKFIKKVELNKWISVEIPLKNIEAFNLENGIETIRLSQNSFDGKEHILFIDQVEFMPTTFPQSHLTGAAVLSSAIGYERHVDLTWKLPLTPSIRYIKFYRSSDNENFEAVAIQPIFTKRYSDVVPLADKSYYYKISWVDYYYRESPFSNVLEVKTKKLKDEELVTMVQKANTSLYIDGEEFNSGMQLENIHSQNSIISIKNTGVGILALIAGIKDDFLLREKVLRRMERVISFLEKTESVNGVFPELLDGRTGRAVYKDNSRKDSVNLIVDLESTGVLMQALLVSKQYFNQNNDVETELRNKITKIWKSVEWNKFINHENLYLFDKWSSEKGINEGNPLSGVSKMYLYIMALASPENNIELESYYKALSKPLHIYKRKINHHDSLLIEENPMETTSIKHYEGNNYQIPFINGHTYYGIPLAVGHKEDDLSEILMGFIALDLTGKKDNFANYYENTNNLIKIQHRQSLEEGDNMFSSRLETSKGIAIYPFNEKLALENLKYYYLNHAESLWTEYGFVREIDFKRNQIIYPKEDVENGLNAVMIDNAALGFIWKLFMQDPDISNVVKNTFKK